MSDAPAPADSWVHTYYGADYRNSVEGILTPERTAAEVSFVLGATGLRPPARVADFGCGHGRHVVELARRGFDVTGVDVNAGSLAIGRVRATGLPATFVQGDYRDPPPGPFDLVLSLFTSFGFGSDEDDARAVDAWCRRLAPGGWLVMELWHRDLIVSDFRPRRNWRASDQLEVDERRTLDPRTGRIHVHYVYTYADGRRTEHDISVRLYSAAELGEMLARGGVREVTLHGSLRGDPYGPGARSLVVVGRRTE